LPTALEVQWLSADDIADINHFPPTMRRAMTAAILDENAKTVSALKAEIERLRADLSEFEELKRIAVDSRYSSELIGIRLRAMLDSSETANII